MNLTKQQKKELRRIYEEKIGKEYVELNLELNHCFKTRKNPQHLCL